MKSRTKNLLTVMNILAWVIFIGLCIKTGAILYSFFVSLFMNEEGAKNLYRGLNLFELKNTSRPDYSIIVLLIISLSALKAYIFYLAIKIFQKINFVHPFSKDVARLITKIGFVALMIGVVALIATSYSEWLMKKGIALNDIHPYIEGDEFLFFAALVFFIAQIFKKGIEIQSENELTV